ncbi:hypothetical protein EsDP_00005144 [Epichloe bromicola]|uniref:Karyogamy protein n=1 Tax=Epichloe bromicola TaxID=79588 RepID=A0ABQ0CTW3_9HYPO
MTSTQLPPLNFGGGELRLSLSAPLSVGSIDKAGPSAVERDDRFEIHEPEQPKEADTPTSPFPPPAQNIPVHPITSLQDAFSESLDEATNGSPGDKPKLRDLDARGRREALLAQNRDEDPFDAKWRYRPGQKQHELLKLIAQISFGVYLLLHGMANSNAQVVGILQGHIDEVDEFLEVALEDLQQATDDLNGRIEHLKLPLANVQVFEHLLEDRKFRLEIIEGNEKIDHVLSRTNTALKQWDGDIEAGMSSAAAFTSWLEEEENASWRRDRPDVADVFDAMKGNTEGWLAAFDDMSDRVQAASNVIMRLSTIIGEMEKKAGEVSRRTWASIPPYSAPSVKSQGSGGLAHGSTKSGASSRQSTRRPSHVPQASLGASTVGSTSIPDINLEEDFPLPGGLPLLPPARSSLRPAQDNANRLPKAGYQSHIKTASQSTHESKHEPRKDNAPAGEESLFLLQPRTYTPQPLESGTPIARPKTASPDTRSSASTATQKNPLDMNGHGLHQRRASILTRVSQKTSPPEAIKIPPRSVAEATLRAASPNSATPRTAQSNPFDSAYGSDADSTTHLAVSRFDSEYSMSPPRRPQITHSPHSDHQQYYRPVRASPHSPLQQRPHTAVGGRMSFPVHLPNQPSALGETSTLSNVTNAVHDDDARTRTSASRTTAGTLKKKKSAFGWFKKAFTMDEDEKAAFEARKAMQHQDRYYNSNSPKFLDGRRIR